MTMIVERSNVLDDQLIIIELQPNSIRGTQDVSINIENIASRSEQALSRALGSIRGLAERLNDSLSMVDESSRPDEVKIEFGLKLTTDASALVVNSGAEGQFTVTLKWIHDKDRQTPNTQFRETLQ